jgi:hypothetical protein
MCPTENLPTYNRLWALSVPKVNQLTSKIYDPEIITETNLLATMAGIPSLTIFSEEQKFNGNKLLQWNTNIIQLLGSKGLTGYIDRKIEKPGPKSIPLPSDTASTQPINTPIYSTTPTLDKWNFRDQLTRGHITLNCTDVAGLGVVTTGMAKQAWDSIKMK